MSAYLDQLETLLIDAEQATDHDTTAAIARASNQVVGDACEAVAKLSADGELSTAEKNQLAGHLADELPQYNKTDLKDEFEEYYQREQSGTAFDHVIEERLDEIVVVKSTDHRQGALFRWHFSDGVQLETETTDDGTRLHRAWPQFKELYFESRVAAGEGERIADPTPERRDSDQWRTFINDLILDHATTVEHVGPRTEAVRQLRDHIERHAAYTDMQTVRNRAGVGIETDAESVDAIDGDTRIRVPTQDIKRICDQVGITPQALQIELDARGLTAGDMGGVSDATYCDGQRFPFWVVTAALAEPATVVEDPDTAAEQLAAEQEADREDRRTSIGAVESDGDGGEGDTPPHPQPQPRDDADGDSAGDSDDYEPGVRDSLGTDPDDLETDRGGGA